MEIEEKEIQSLRSANAILRKAASKNLGPGYWGLEPNHSLPFTHEEIVFLFARIFRVLGFESVRLVQQPYPDCTAVRDGEEKRIEFEAALSTFDHDPSECDFIICWEDDLPDYSGLKRRIQEANTKVIQLKLVWEKIQVRKPRKPFEYEPRDFERMSRERLRILSVFVGPKEEKGFLELDEIAKRSDIKGKKLGAILGSFFQAKERDWLIKHCPGGYQFNEKYREMIKKVVSEARISTVSDNAGQPG